MKRFLDAMAVLEEYEGGYVNHPVDPGGETYRGISRVYYPDWWGWQIIDNEDDLGNESIMRELERLTYNFYRMQYWNRFQGDALSDISVPITTEMLECSVNLGVTRCVSFLQRGLNLLNRNGKLYKDLVVDGKVGPATITTMDHYLDSRPPDRVAAEHRLLNIMNALQGNHYINQMERYPEKEEFRGWFDRINFLAKKK